MGKIIMVRVFVTLLMLYSLFFSLPILIAIIYKEYNLISSFAIPAIVVIVCGLPIMFFTRNYKGSTNLKQGLLLVPISWMATVIVGAIPYMLSGIISDFAGALFEASSGLTTTGASVLTNLEVVPKAILFWRALTHWLGGMGIVVLVVALFPQVGMGGNIMLAAESPGPTLEKITPKINEMAKVFWLLYISLTALQTVLLVLGGMHWFDSITHSFATLATGGFSTQNNSIMAFEHSSYLQVVITIFMILAGTNFAMYFAIIKGTISTIWRDSELKMYLLIIAISGLIIASNLLFYTNMSVGQSFRDAFFQVATITTTTGFVSANYELWPFLSQGVLFLLMFVGGCGGSTGGGIKVVRITVLLKYIRCEIIKFFSPRRVEHISLNNKVVGEEYIKRVMFFVSCYIFLLLLVTIVVSAGNHDVITSFTTALATLGNIGPGFGEVGPVNNYALFAPWLKIFLSLVMITGRLELFSVLVIFSPRFWK